MRRKSIFLLTATVITSFCAVLFLRSAFAQGGGRIVARSQFRSTDSSGTPDTVNPIGSLTLTENGGKEVFTLRVKNKFLTDLSIYLGLTNYFDGTNTPVIVVAPVTRGNIKLGSWTRTLTGTAGAPPEFQFIGVANLADLSDIDRIDIGNPGTTNIVGGTNFITCVQTPSSNGITITVCTTNIIGGGHQHLGQFVCLGAHTAHCCQSGRLQFPQEFYNGAADHSAGSQCPWQRPVIVQWLEWPFTDGHQPERAYSGTRIIRCGCPMAGRIFMAQMCSH